MLRMYSGTEKEREKSKKGDTVISIQNIYHFSSFFAGSLPSSLFVFPPFPPLRVSSQFARTGKASISMISQIHTPPACVLRSHIRVLRRNHLIDIELVGLGCF